MLAARLGVLALILTSLFVPAPADQRGAATPRPTGPPRYVEGEVLLKFRQGVSGFERTNIRNEMNAWRMHNFASGAEHWRLGPGLAVDEAVRRLLRDARIAYAEPNYLLIPGTEPNDPRFPEQWGLKNTGQLAGTVDADVDAELAWDLATGSSSVIVAVLDSGVDASHEDLAANMWTNPGEFPGSGNNGIDDDMNGYIDDVKGWDFVENDNNPSPYPDILTECQVGIRWHGTAVAGVAGAVADNSKGIAGINWSVKIMALRVADAGIGDVARVVKAVDYARVKGAHVINFSHTVLGFNQTLYEAIVRAGDAGIAFVASAMNNNNNNDAVPIYPASYDLPNVIAVANTDRNDLKALNSNYGNGSVDLGAPGSAILTTSPSWGDTQPYCGELPPPGASYRLRSGTSFAAPLVAGSVALMRSENLDATVADLKCRLLTTTDPLPSLIFRTVSGGRLNAKRAIDSLLANEPCSLPQNRDGVPAFQFRATIYGSPNPNYTKTNLISLPYDNVFQGPGGPEALCQAFDLSNNATVAQYNSAGTRLVHHCGDTPTFNLLDLKGVEIIERHPQTKQGIIEGWDVPGAQITIEDLGSYQPAQPPNGVFPGHNLFPVRYNGTAKTPEDLCSQCCLSSQAMITRFNAANGTVESHVCGQLPLWNLVLGEAVLIQEPNGPKTCVPWVYGATVSQCPG